MHSDIIDTITSLVSPARRFVVFSAPNRASLVTLSALSTPSDFVPRLCPRYFSGNFSASAKGDTIFLSFSN